MIPFLRARDEALKLRHELVGDQANLPVPSSALLSRIESVLNLGVQEVPPTSGLLKGGKATLRRAEAFIYYRNDYDWPEKAYLIAHELGHYRLDADAGECTAHFDVGTHSASSLASAHVEAYGARERDELQKNVFGRELLLPRQIARTLFLGGQGPEAIAKSLGLPLEVARQQVLDAVLLPTHVPLLPAALPTPSPDQQEAIDALEKHVHVVAGPGTGKTTTLVHRVKRLIEHNKVDPHKILVLTFTNKAAADLVDRLQRAKVAGASEIWAGTFHAFGLEFLRKYYQHFDLAPEFAVADKLTQLTLTARALAHANLEHFSRTDDPYEWLPSVIDVALRVKEELVGIHDYLNKAVTTTSDELELARFRDVATVADAYQKALQEAGMVDFVDLVAKPALAIAADRAKFALVADRYQYILVDEFQDLTAAMMALIEQLSQNADSLWVVGDVRQAIYHWRGASLDALIGFEGRFASARRCNLVVNRRSVQEVIDLTVAVGRHHPLEAILPLSLPTCMRGPNGFPASLVRASSRRSMWQSVVDNVRINVANGIPLRQQTVVARKGTAVADAANALKVAGIPVLYVGELMERSEVKDILAVIQLIVERNPRALLRVGELAEPPMGRADVQATLTAVEKNGSLKRLAWLKCGGLPLSAQGTASSLDLAHKLHGFAWSTSPWEFVCEILLERRFLLTDLFDESIEGHLRRLAQWQFAYMARVADGERKRPTLYRFLSRLRLRQQIRDVYIDRELPPETNGLEGVRVMTVHASKGLEFESVHVVSIDGADFAGADDLNPLLPPQTIGRSPKRHSFESDVEAHNLLYVAVSRAKDTLNLYEANTEYKFKKVDALENAVSLRVLIPRLGPVVETALATGLVNATESRPSSVTNEQFITYDRCPRQYLYRFGMEMGQELSPNPALQARALVLRTLKTLAQSGRYDLLVRTFSQGWQQASLPEKGADPQLWQQAFSAAAAGVAFLDSVKGEFLSSTADVGGLSVGLPWGIALPDAGGSLLHCVDFYSKSLNYQKRQDTILGQLMFLTTTAVPVSRARLFDLNRRTIREVCQVSVYRKSTVTTRAQGLKGGAFDPVESRYPCSRCAYSYICPSLLHD